MTELMRGTLTPAYNSNTNSDGFSTPPKFSSPPFARLRKRRNGQSLDDLIAEEDDDSDSKSISSSEEDEEHSDVPEAKSSKRPKTSVDNVYQFDKTEDALAATIVFLMSDTETQDHCRKLGEMLKVLAKWKAESKTRTYFITKAIREIGSDGRPKAGDNWICAGSYLACEAAPAMMVLPEILKAQATPLLASFYVVEVMMRMIAAPEVHSALMTSTRLHASHDLVQEVRACCRVADISYRELRISETFPVGYSYEWEPPVWTFDEGTCNSAFHVYEVDTSYTQRGKQVATLTATSNNTVDCASKCLDELALWRNAKLLQQSLEINLECDEVMGV